MIRIFALACAALVSCFEMAGAATRDETVVFVLLGYEPGDKFTVGDKKIFFNAIRRLDEHTIEVELREGETIRFGRIREEPACVFEITINNTSRKIDFTNAYGAKVNSPRDFGLVGKNVQCREGSCSDFARLGGLNLDERHQRATEYMRKEYCPGQPY